VTEKRRKLKEIEEKQSEHQASEALHCDDDIVRNVFPNDITTVQAEAKTGTCHATPISKV
jgi:hypothetical protein